MTQETVIQKRETPSAQPEPIRSGRTYIPVVDIIEQADRLLLVADMPGVKPADVDINYDQGLLTIHGKVMPRQRSQEPEYLLQEYGVGDFYRTFQIGEGIESSKIEAQLHDGVLTLQLPKTQEVMPRKILVKTA